MAFTADNQLGMPAAPPVRSAGYPAPRYLGDFAGIAFRMTAGCWQLSATGIDIYRIVDSKIADQWYEMDFTGLLQQLREGLNH